MGNIYIEKDAKSPPIPHTHPIGLRGGFKEWVDGWVAKVDKCLGRFATYNGGVQGRVGGWVGGMGGLITSFNIYVGLFFLYLGLFCLYTRVCVCGMGGLITSFTIYISHVKKCTSKINEEGEGLRRFFLDFFCYEVFAKQKKKKRFTSHF